MLTICYVQSRYKWITLFQWRHCWHCSFRHYCLASPRLASIVHTISFCSYKDYNWLVLLLLCILFSSFLGTRHIPTSAIPLDADAGDLVWIPFRCFHQRPAIPGRLILLKHLTRLSQLIRLIHQVQLARLVPDLHLQTSLIHCNSGCDCLFSGGFWCQHHSGSLTVSDCPFPPTQKNLVGKVVSEDGMCSHHRPHHLVD